MIILEDRHLISVSGPRACYLHPGDENKVVKIVIKKPFSRRKNANYQEWRHYNYLMKRHGLLAFVNECYGFTETNRGKGLVWRCVRDADGDISKTVTHVLKHRKAYDLKAIQEELRRFCRILINRNIQLFDLNPLNVLIRIGKDGTYEAVSADIKGRYANYEFIPISTYIPYFSRRKLRNRTNELLERFDGIV